MRESLNASMLPDPTQEDQFGINFESGEQGENKGSNEEPQLNFLFSNINRIWSYLRKEGEHCLLELKNQVTANPCVFGAHLEKVSVPYNKVEMGVFLKKHGAAERWDTVGRQAANNYQQGVCIQKF